MTQGKKGLPKFTARYAFPSGHVQPSAVYIDLREALTAWGQHQMPGRMANASVLTFSRSLAPSDIMACTALESRSTFFTKMACHTCSQTQGDFVGQAAMPEHPEHIGRQG